MNETNTNHIGKMKVSTVALSVAVAFFLTLVKVAAGLITHSMAVLASAADSLMDMLMSLINLFAAHKSEKPADKEHPYGHGKVEHIAGLFQCFLMALTVVYLIAESIKRMIVGSYVAEYSVGIGVMIFSIVVTFLLVIRLRWVAKKTNSVLIETEDLHFSSDILTNLGVVAALLIVKWTGAVIWDLIFSILISIYIGYYVYKIGIKSVQQLMDHEPPKSVQQEIRDFVLRFDPKIVDSHDFRSRSVGNQIFTEFHITIRDERSFVGAHALTERLKIALQKKFPDLEATIHYDPYGLDEAHEPELPE